jgi:hypothetical protein
MVADVDWANLNVAAAFVLGAVLATIATIRIVRAVFGVRRDEARKDDVGAVRVDVIAVLEIVVLVLTIVYVADKIWG